MRQQIKLYIHVYILDVIFLIHRLADSEAHTPCVCPQCLK